MDARSEIRSEQIDRRRFIGAAAGAGALALGAPALAQKGRGEVVIAVPGGLLERGLQDHFYRRFEAETGIRVRSVGIELPDQWARVRAGQASGNVPFDVVTATPPDLIQYADVLEPLDCKGMPGIVEHALPDSCFANGLIRTVGAAVLTWNKAAFPNGGPSSWADFFDVKRFPGPRSLPDTGDRDWWVPAVALIADGVEPGKLFPLDLDRAYRKLDTIKPHVAAWWKSGDNAVQIMRGGDAVMALLLTSRAFLLVKEGSFDFTWKQALRDVGDWAVLKGGPNTANGVRFLDFFVKDATTHAKFGNAVNFDSNNRDAASLVAEGDRRFHPSWPDNWKELIVADYGWIAGHRKALRERWVSWLTA